MKTPAQQVVFPLLMSLLASALALSGATANGEAPKPRSQRDSTHLFQNHCESTTEQSEAPNAVIGQSIVVEIGDRPRSDVPVSVALSGMKEPNSKSPAKLRLIETTGGVASPVPSQLESSAPPRLWWILKGESAAGAKRTFRIESGEPAEGADISVERRPDFLELRSGESPVLRYNTAHLDPPAGLNSKFGRSGFIHPVWTPSGKIVTEQFPADHAHQSGIFLAYVKTEFEGRTPDFWNLAGGTGRVRFKALHGTSSGPVFGELHVEHEHVDLSGSEPKVALNETWKVRVWNIGGSRVGYWICDITSESKCATSNPLKLNQYHYGGMALRGAGDWGNGKGRFLTSDGKDRKSGNHTRPHWCDLSGPVGENTAGLAIMTHPMNFRFPEPLRIHSSMPYMVYTPSHLGDWEIKPGQSHNSRYRFVIHDGELPKPTLDRIWEDFGEPLVAKVQTAGPPHVGFDVQSEAVYRHLSPSYCWFHPRVAALPGHGEVGQPAVIMTIQKHLAADDHYSGLYFLRTNDLGKSWTCPTEIPELAWQQGENNETIAVCDVTPGWHTPTGKLIAIGTKLRYSQQGAQLLDKPRSHECAYAIYDPKTDKWTKWRLLALPDTESKFFLVAPGCVQWLVKSDGTLLVPMYFKGQAGSDYISTVLHCTFDGQELKYLEHGDELATSGGRGFVEPSLAYFQGRYFLTLRNDAAAYVTTSSDGLHFNPAKKWIFDDGADLGSYNTQAHWLVHDRGLFLTYTRRGANNDHIARNRAPIFIAQVDPEKLTIFRTSERVLLPERGVMLGNFGAAAITRDESWVTDAEFLVGEKPHPKGADGTVWLGRVKWLDANAK